MDFLDRFRNKKLILETADKIQSLSKRPVTFMEVCGGHTMAIQKAGIPSLIPKHIRLLSGPGCPVCVTDCLSIDAAIAYASLPGVMVVTFGDLMRVPGSFSSLNEEKAKGADVRVVYSALDALVLARQHPEKKIVFLAIGFETTAPGTAVAIKEAHDSHLLNFLVFSVHKIMPPAMESILRNGTLINGYLAPGHVSTITGADIFRFIPDNYNIPVVISGFEPLDILQSLLLLVRQIECGQAKVEIQYQRVVSFEGNKRAKSIVDEVFELHDVPWRGFGILPGSGLRIRSKYGDHDVTQQIPLSLRPAREPEGCICGDILRGLKTAPDCRLFKTVCTPDNPVGACMVSNEGACHAYYRFSL